MMNMTPIERLSAEQFKSKTPTDRMWSLYDSIWTCHDDHETRIVSLEQRRDEKLADSAAIRNAQVQTRNALIVAGGGVVVAFISAISIIVVSFI